MKNMKIKKKIPNSRCSDYNMNSPRQYQRKYIVKSLENMDIDVNHEWPRQNFSLQYQYNIKQTSDEIKEKYQLGDYKLIQYQILQTNIIRTVW